MTHQDTQHIPPGDRDDGAPPPSPAPNGPLLWHPEDGRFDRGRLRRAIVARGWTIPHFALAGRIHVRILYHVLSGRPTDDGTAIRIFQTPGRRRPMDLDLWPPRRNAGGR